MKYAAWGGINTRFMVRLYRRKPRSIILLGMLIDDLVVLPAQKDKILYGVNLLVT
ncbi:MAG: hypothetical protein WBF66_08665 [Dehalococcoidia bacterium]